MSEKCKENFDLQELKWLLLAILQDREEIRKLNEKRFNSMLALYNASKNLYEETLKIQKDLIKQYSIDKINEKKSLASSKYILLVGLVHTLSL